MKVAHVVWEGRLSGPPSRVLTLAPRLEELGIETLLVLPDEGTGWLEELDELPCAVEPLPLGRMRGRPDPLLQLRWLAGLRGDRRRLEETFRRHGVDLVHSYGLANQQALHAGWELGLPLVWHLNDVLTPGWYKRLLKGRLQRWPAALLVDGPGVARAHGLDPDDLTGAGEVVYPCYDEDRFHPGVEPASDVAPADLPRDALLAVTVGNLNPAKGYEHLIPAFLQALEREPRLRLVVVGAVLETQAALHRGLVERLEAAGARDRVRFLGLRMDVPRVLAAADLYVQASVSETGPATVAEAAAVGLPVVATDVGLVREMVADGETGFVVPPGDAGALAEAWLRVARDPERAALGRAGALRVRERFGARASAERLARVYRSVASGGSADTAG